MTCVFLSFNPFYLEKLDVLFRGIRRRNLGSWKMRNQPVVSSASEVGNGNADIVKKRFLFSFPHLFSSYFSNRCFENRLILCCNLLSTFGCSCLLEFEKVYAYS